MKWNVYYHNINARKIETFNIFDHGSFKEYVKKAVKKCKNKDEFSEQLRRELFYYFGSKSEWELLFSPWVGGDPGKESVKVDVYRQIMNNFEIFVDYVWDNKAELYNKRHKSDSKCGMSSYCKYSENGKHCSANEAVINKCLYLQAIREIARLCTESDDGR